MSFVDDQNTNSSSNSYSIDDKTELDNIKDMKNLNNVQDSNNNNTTYSKSDNSNNSDTQFQQKSSIDFSSVNNDPNSKDVIALMKVASGEAIDVESLSDIPRAIAKIVPKVIEKLVKEYEDLYGQRKELQQKVTFLSSSKDVQKEVFLEALGHDSYSPDKIALLPAEARNIVRDYVSLRVKINKTEEKIEKLAVELKKIQEYIEDYGLKTQVKPDLDDDFSKLMETVEKSMSRISENVRVNLYRQISSALSTGNSDTLPRDLLELIHTLVIERLENILRPYEELSGKYVAGDLTHEEFTDKLKKNALLSLLREKVIEDIIREYENNNLSSPVIPMRLKLATDRMINDARNLSHVMQSEGPIRVVSDETDSTDKSSLDQHNKDSFSDTYSSNKDNSISFNIDDESFDKVM